MIRKQNTTLIRLDASPYQGPQFFEKEQEMAQRLGLDYQFLDFRHQTKVEATTKKNILISNTHTPVHKIPPSLLDQTLLWLHPNSGYDNFTPQWIQDQKFPIILGNSIRAPGVSEYILSCLFHHYSFLPHQEDWQKTRTWKRLLLKDQKVVIVGKGHVGKLIFKALSPLVDNLTVFDPYLKEENLYEGKLETLIPGTDVLILSASLNNDNRGFINQNLLNLMSENFCLINTARGALIDQKALIFALKSKPNAFAYLDVFEKEPFGKEFEELKNIHTTSHMAGVSKTLEQRILQFEETVLGAFLTSSRENFKNHHKDSLLQNRLVGKDFIL